MLLWRVTIPSQRLFLFFSLDHVSICHGPNRKQMAYVQKILKRVERDYVNHVYGEGSLHRLGRVEARQ